MNIANLSINETLSRTILLRTTLLLIFNFYFGGEILRGFSFAMILGVIIGTYSSIFVASVIVYIAIPMYEGMQKEEEKII